MTWSVKFPEGKRVIYDTEAEARFFQHAAGTGEISEGYTDSVTDEWVEYPGFAEREAERRRQGHFHGEPKTPEED